MMIRHGDVILRKVEGKSVSGLKKVETDIIEAGEASGHHHRLVGNAELFADSNGQVELVEVVEGYLVHEEHNPVQIEKGTYEVVRQVEYNPYEKAAQRVMD